jgi:hypothetical protein
MATEIKFVRAMCSNLSAYRLIADGNETDVYIVQQDIEKDEWLLGRWTPEHAFIDYELSGDIEEPFERDAAQSIVLHRVGSIPDLQESEEVEFLGFFDFEPEADETEEGTPTEATEMPEYRKDAEDTESSGIIIGADGQGRLFKDESDVVDERYERAKNARDKAKADLARAQEEKKEASKLVKSREAHVHHCEIALTIEDARLQSFHLPDRGVVPISFLGKLKVVFASNIREYPLNEINIYQPFVAGIESTFENAEAVDDAFMEGQKAWQKAGEAKPAEAEAEALSDEVEADAEAEPAGGEEATDGEMPKIEDGLPPLPDLDLSDLPGDVKFDDDPAEESGSAADSFSDDEIGLFPEVKPETSPQKDEKSNDPGKAANDSSKKRGRKPKKTGNFPTDTNEELEKRAS